MDAKAEQERLCHQVETEKRILERTAETQEGMIKDLETSLKEQTSKAERLTEENESQKVRIEAQQEELEFQKQENELAGVHRRTLEAAKFEWDRKLTSQIEQCDHQ